MLKLSKSQAESFEVALREQLYRRILAWLKKELSEHVRGQDDSELLRRIKACDQSAFAYGVKTDVAVTQFVVLSLLAGADFHLQPSTQRFLTHDQLTGDQKMRLLVNMINARQGG